MGCPRSGQLGVGHFGASAMATFSYIMLDRPAVLARAPSSDPRSVNRRQIVIEWLSIRLSRLRIRRRVLPASKEGTASTSSRTT